MKGQPACYHIAELRIPLQGQIKYAILTPYTYAISLETFPIVLRLLRIEAK